MPNKDPFVQPFWPAQRLQPAKDLPLAFCHVEGEEETSAIKTSHSNEQSKANTKEVEKVVGVMCDGLQTFRLKSSAKMNDSLVLEFVGINTAVKRTAHEHKI